MFTLIPIVEEEIVSNSTRTGTSARSRIANLERMSKFDQAQELRNKYNIPSNDQKPQFKQTNLTLVAIIEALISSGIIPSDKIELARGLANNTNSSEFTRDLELNDVNEEVKMLQQFLNKNDYVISQSGPGSVGNETNIFGSLTKAALIRFQQDNNILPAAGYFGPLTRDFISKNY
jgi:hypothetical protein